ncbi:MAG TPA: universal stress protein [Solirubrobacteraceae bacterium]|nr:universal stress protein [Solirubrobacteraceae bacterium]
MSHPTIVVSADGTPAAALRRAGEVAAAASGRILLVSAYRPVGASRLRAEQRAAQRRGCPEELLWTINAAQDVDARLEQARAQIIDSVPVLTRVHHGGVAESVLEAARQEHADLLMVGTDKQRVMRCGQRRLNARLAQQATCDVMIVYTNG